MTIVDLFAGPGGWDLGAALIGLPDPVGVELDATACETRRAAGLTTVHRDVSLVDVDKVPTDTITGLIASPPCTMFSKAGTRSGSDAVHLIGPAMAPLLAGVDVRAQLADDIATEIRPAVYAALTARGETTARQIDGEAKRRARMAALVVEPARWIHALDPEWIALEQVPDVLPLWEELAAGLRSIGYSTWTGLLCAADYGVAQTRTRAILIASRTRTVAIPPPSHAEHPTPSLFAAEPAPWISMADALGWHSDATDWRINTGNNSATAGGGTTTYERSVGRPSPTLTGNTGRGWRLNPGITASQPNRRTRPADRPAPTLAFGRDAANWRWEHADPGHPGVVCGPAGIRGEIGDVDPSWPSTRPRNAGLRLTTAEALVLQSFPPGHPIAGGMTAQFLQIGNAIPPLLAAHVLAEATGLAPPAVTVTTHGPPAATLSS